MDPLTASVILVLLIIFAIICIKAATKKYSSNIYTSAGANPEGIEYEVRELLLHNQNSKIIVLCYDCDSETKEILEKLTKDYPQITIRNQ